VLWPGDLDPPLAGVRSPFALPAGTLGVLGVVRLTLGVLTGAGLVVAGLSLLVRFRRSEGLELERRRLLWLAIVVIPFPVYVVIAFLSASDHPLLLALATGGFIGLVPVAAGLSIVRYHLYDVERGLSRAVTYLLVSGILAVTFAVVVVTAGRLVGDRGGSSQLPAVLGTLAAVAVAAPAYRAFQEAVDRRFNRRRYDTLRVIRNHVRAPAPQTDVDVVLREALGDPALRTAYWVDGRRQWVSGPGHPVEPAAGDIVIQRHGRPIARIGYDASAVDRELAEAAGAEATPELENAGLRAAVALQLTEVRESRARIAAAQLTERRRIERDLHDGAQQRLLALALQLQAALVNGDAGRLRAEVAAGVGEIRTAVAELRELANGLHPAVLSDSGLAAALDELAARLPLRVELDATDVRFPAPIESTAWFIACEAISNAVKHSGADRIEVDVQARDGLLTLRVADDGCGGADPDGTGLRGIADRAEALGGRLTVSARDGGGTTVTAEMPCAS
jgi:signal transduction histidine kinase